jgi:hypothetical protein
MERFKKTQTLGKKKNPLEKTQTLKKKSSLEKTQTFKKKMGKKNALET